MKTSMIVKSIAALAIGATFPLGAMAAQPSKMMTERGVIEKVDTATSRWSCRTGEAQLAADLLYAIPTVSNGSAY
jgi:hypothetical protein